MRSRRARLGAALAIVLVLAPVSLALARQYSWLGVRIRDLSEQEMDDIATRHGIREGFGVFVVDVVAGAPAAGAGLKGGDVIVAFGDQPVVDTRALQRLVAAASPESGVQITVLRAEGRRTVSVHLATMPRDVLGERVAAEFGFMLRDPDSPRRPEAIEDPRAPAIVVVTKGGPGERAGLEVGDVVVRVNDTAVTTRDAARDALSDVAPDAPLRLTVRRGGQTFPLTLPAP